MKAKKDDSHEKLRSFEGICREHNLSVTPQRTAVFKELIASDEHPSANMIYRKVRRYFPNISLDTVNRTLLTFQEIGLAKVVESTGEPKRFDPNLEQHHHFRCIRCGRIIDFQNSSWDEIEVPEEIAERFTVLGKMVHLEGVCDTCEST